MEKNLAIVCVDDEKVVLDSLQEQLENSFGDMDILIEIAESADEAWEVIEELIEDGYELVMVISDWLMPRTKGDKFLVDLHEQFPSALTIMLTGQADSEAVENARQNANLYAYIKKPWRSDDLIQRIRTGFDQAQVLRD
jgi:DNA-binding NtrC family response regulator